MFGMEKIIQRRKNVTRHKISTYEFFHKKINYYRNLANQKAILMEIGKSTKYNILDLHFQQLSHIRLTIS
jgi:hypothetical protein